MKTPHYRYFFETEFRSPHTGNVHMCNAIESDCRAHVSEEKQGVRYYQSGRRLDTKITYKEWEGMLKTCKLGHIFRITRAQFLTFRRNNIPPVDLRLKRLPKLGA